MIVTVREYYLQIQIPLKAGKFGGAKVGGQDLLGEELAVRDGEGTAGRAPCDERIAIANCGGWRCCGEEERWLCGTASAGTRSSGVLLLSCRFHLEHLVEAAGELLGNSSLPRFREGNGGGEGGGVGGNGNSGGSGGGGLTNGSDGGSSKVHMATELDCMLQSLPLHTVHPLRPSGLLAVLDT